MLSLWCSFVPRVCTEWRICIPSKHIYKIGKVVRLRIYKTEVGNTCTHIYTTERIKRWDIINPCTAARKKKAQEGILLWWKSMSMIFGYMSEMVDVSLCCTDVQCLCILYLDVSSKPIEMPRVLLYFIRRMVYVLFSFIYEESWWGMF